MIRAIACFFAFGLGVDSVGSREPVKGDPPHDAKMMAGDWVVRKAIRAGQEMPAERTAKMTMKVDGNTIAIGEEGSAREERAAFKLDPKMTPAAIDLTPKREGARAMPGIYKFEGDTLTLCWARDGDRPTKFESKEGSNVAMLVLQRVKK